MRHPITKWAQRSDEVYLSIELPDARDVSLQLRPEGRFIFSATKDGVPYEIDIELFDEVNVEESQSNIGVRHISYTIKKAEKKWWTRILKQEGKPPAFLKIDWDRWVEEEDDEDEKNNKGIDDSACQKKSRTKKRREKKCSPLEKLIQMLKINCVCTK